MARGQRGEQQRQPLHRRLGGAGPRAGQAAEQRAESPEAEEEAGGTGVAGGLGGDRDADLHGAEGRLEEEKTPISARTPGERRAPVWAASAVVGSRQAREAAWAVNAAVPARSSAAQASVAAAVLHAPIPPAMSTGPAM